MVEGVKYWRKFSKKRAKNGRNSAIKLAILANFWCQNGEIGQKKIWQHCLIYIVTTSLVPLPDVNLRELDSSDISLTS